MIPPLSVRGVVWSLVLMAGAVVSRAAVAQPTVSATSGSPATITRIRAVVDSVERNVRRYRQTTHDLDGFSLEGGEVRGFYEGTELRKLTARHYGESARWTEEVYFGAGEPVFIFAVTERYDSPLRKRIGVRRENRFYLTNGQAIRIVRSQIPKASTYGFPDDDDVAQLLGDLKVLMACAADPQKDARACTRQPESGAPGK